MKKPTKRGPVAVTTTSGIRMNIGIEWDKADAAGQKLACAVFGKMLRAVLPAADVAKMIEALNETPEREKP